MSNPFLHEMFLFKNINSRAEYTNYVARSPFSKSIFFSIRETIPGHVMWDEVEIRLKIYFHSLHNLFASSVSCLAASTCTQCIPKVWKWHGEEQTQKVWNRNVRNVPQMCELHASTGVYRLRYYRIALEVDNNDREDNDGRRIQMSIDIDLLHRTSVKWNSYRE